VGGELHGLVVILLEFQWRNHFHILLVLFVSPFSVVLDLDSLSS
jgi:hypothetical protein